MAHGTKGLVEILEVVERYVKGINKIAFQNFLEKINSIKQEDMDKSLSDYSNFENDFSEKFNLVIKKEAEMIRKIDSAQDGIDKINKFIKR